LKSAIKRLDFWKGSGNHRLSGNQILVKLSGIHRLGVRVEAIWDQAHIESPEISGDLLVPFGTQHVDVG
jgi:hypothetical protein